MAAAGPARALEFRCVESSKYKYLAAAFDNDVQKLADYLGTGRGPLPPREACRAVIATGGTVGGDEERLLAAVRANQGWLAIVYLDSGGGKVFPAMKSALLARLFWLKTATGPAREFKFRPDFFPLPHPGVPEDPRVAALETATRSVESSKGASKGTPWCASACTFILAAGSDRRGVAHLHRAGVGGTSIAQVNEGVGNALTLMDNAYRKLGMGEEFSRIARDTAKQTVTPKTAPRFPSFVEDAYTERCRSDVAQLDDVAALLDYARARAARTAGLVPPAQLEPAVRTVAARSDESEQCVARLNEKERLDAFRKYCGRGCTIRSLAPQIDKQFNALKG